MFKAKTKLNYESCLYFFHAFEVFIPSLTITFGEVTASVLLNIAISGSLASRKTLKMSILRPLF